MVSNYLKHEAFDKWIDKRSRNVTFNTTLQSSANLALNLTRIQGLLLQLYLVFLFRLSLLVLHPKL
jgi:hypothetical protein